MLDSACTASPLGFSSVVLAAMGRHARDVDRKGEGCSNKTRFEEVWLAGSRNNVF